MTPAIAVPALPAHVHLIAARMREADRLEVLASDGLRPGQAIRRSMKGSDFARTLFIGGAPAAIFGVRLDQGVGVPWALTTDVVDRYPVAFWKASVHVVREMRSRYPVLVQCIDARYERALRWAARLGFDVDRNFHACGPFKAPFHHVFLKRAG